MDLIELGPCVVGVGDTATLATKSDDVQAKPTPRRSALVAEQLGPYALAWISFDAGSR